MTPIEIGDVRPRFPMFVADFFRVPNVHDAGRRYGGAAIDAGRNKPYPEVFILASPTNEIFIISVNDFHILFVDRQVTAKPLLPGARQPQAHQERASVVSAMLYLQFPVRDVGVQIFQQGF